MMRKIVKHIPQQPSRQVWCRCWVVENQRALKLSLRVAFRRQHGSYLPHLLAHPERMSTMPPPERQIPKTLVHDSQSSDRGMLRSRSAHRFSSYEVPRPELISVIKSIVMLGHRYCILLTSPFQSLKLMFSPSPCCSSSITSSQAGFWIRAGNANQ